MLGFFERLGIARVVEFDHELAGPNGERMVLHVALENGDLARSGSPSLESELYELAFEMMVQASLPNGGWGEQPRPTNVEIREWLLGQLAAVVK